METTINSEANSKDATIQIQNSEDFKKLDLTKFSPKQIFNYNCTNCGRDYERKLYMLKQSNFELLCRACSRNKHFSEEQKRAALEKRKQTCIARYGAGSPLQSKEVKEKIRKTNLEKYGVENPLQSEKIQEKRKQTNLTKYGVEAPLQSEKIQAKVKQTNLKKYGVENPFQIERVKKKRKKVFCEKFEEIQEKKKQTSSQKYGVENPLQSEKVKEKIKQTNLQRYGVKNPRSSAVIKEKIKQTNLENLGVENPLQSEKIKERIKQTNLERYGVEHPLHSEEVRKRIKEKTKQTNLERYGVEYYFQSKEMQSKRKQAYRYDSVNFDSKPELAFYVYCKDHEVEIKRNTQEFLYEFQGKIHRYFPDFVVEGELVEIKGNQFLNETTATWQNPFDHSQDESYEAKHQCALKNNVRILYSEDYQKCLDYVLEKYGKGFFEKCKS